LLKISFYSNLRKNDFSQEFFSYNMPPKLRSTSQNTINNPSNSNSQAVRNKKDTNKGKTQQPALTNIMEVDPQNTEQYNNTNSNSNTQEQDNPPSPRGFNTTEITTPNWFEKPSETFNTLNKGKGKEQQQSEVPKTISKPPVDWQVEYGRQRYKMFVPATEVPGKDDTSKINSISKALTLLESFTSIRINTIQGNKMIIALFGAKADADKATSIKLSDSHTIQMRESPVYNEITAKGKMIRAWDIPLNVTPDDVRTVFSKYGEIKSLRLQTIGMWQSANIEFTNQEEYDKLATRWAIPMKADLIRIFPFLNTNSIKEERNQHVLKLTNLPPATTGYDLQEIIKDSKAQTCYIPRTNNYRRKRFAILSFKSEEDMEAARDSFPTLGNTELTWVETSTKTCAVCSSIEHLAKECPIKQQQTHQALKKKENDRKFGHLYNRYRPIGVKTTKTTLPSKHSFNKSFADVVKQKQNNIKPVATNPISQLTQNTQQPSLTDILSAIHQLGEEIKNLQNEIYKMDTRIGYLEDDSYYYHMYESEIVTEEKEQESKLDNRTHTPPPQIAIPEEQPFNYQRKRPALSPAQDIREIQNSLHDRIDTMGNTLENLVSSVVQLGNLNNQTNSEHTISSHSDQ
jgi:hypothetical protein